MNIEPKKVWVVGHKNPDTDSICAAISYAYLKNQLGERQYVPKRAGAISEETRYVLDYFKVEDPELITDVGAQLKDISIRKTAGISSQISLKKASVSMDCIHSLIIITKHILRKVLQHIHCMLCRHFFFR